MKTEKTVSVIIPVFNGEKFIAEAIESVLQQSVQGEQIILVDDGSTDRTRDEIAKFGDHITYLYQENGGPSKARNTGILAAKTDFISFLDSDDTWHQKKLEKQFSEFEKFSNLKITLGLSLVFQFIPGGHLSSGYRDEKPEFKLSFGSSLMKKSVFDDVGLLDEELKVGEDTDWFYRAKEKNVPISVQRDVVQYVRKHENNFTSNNRIGKLSVLKVLKKAKDRKQSTNVREMLGMNKPTDMDELINMWNTVLKNS